MNEEIQKKNTHKKNFGIYSQEHPRGKAIREALKKMAHESPRCVMLGIYENETGCLVSQITDGTILDPGQFSCFMSRVHKTAEEAMTSRFEHISKCDCRLPINHVMVETERFMMISRRIGKHMSILLVLRSPVECIGMPIELLDRWKDRISELVIDSKDPLVS